MTRGEAINWIINLTADIGKVEHQDLWHYEQALEEIRDMIEAMPSAQRKLDEWCKDCSEYDHERHCCPRFNRVIRDTVDEVKVNQWIPCRERMPEEDHWLGGSGRQFSDEVLVSVVNCDDEDIWTYISQTIDGEWALELPRHYKIIAWMPLPEPYKEGEKNG